MEFQYLKTADVMEWLLANGCRYDREKKRHVYRIAVTSRGRINGSGAIIAECVSPESGYLLREIAEMLAEKVNMQLERRWGIVTDEGEE